jgi:hypothetical protein
MLHTTNSSDGRDVGSAARLIAEMEISAEARDNYGAVESMQPSVETLVELKMVVGPHWRVKGTLREVLAKGSRVKRPQDLPEPIRSELLSAIEAAKKQFKPPPVETKSGSDSG